MWLNEPGSVAVENSLPFAGRGDCRNIDELWGGSDATDNDEGKVLVRQLSMICDVLRSLEA